MRVTVVTVEVEGQEPFTSHQPTELEGNAAIREALALAVEGLEYVALAKGEPKKT